MPVSKESREQLGQALAEAREEAGLTVVQLAQIASPGRAGGLSRYYDAEAGRRMATSETVSHYASALGRADLQDLRNKILSKRPSTISRIESGGPDQERSPDNDEQASGQTTDQRTDDATASAQLERSSYSDNPYSRESATDALPRPELLPDSLLLPVQELVAEQTPLLDGTVVRGREGILRAACALLDEAIAICTDERRSVSVQIIQLNSERTFTRNLGQDRDHVSSFFPFQIQRLITAGGSVRHLLSHHIMHTLDMWSAFERFISLMELAGDYSVYWPSTEQPRSRMPDYLIIENVAALEVFPTGPLTWAGDAAIVHRDTSEVLSVIKDFGENLIAEADEAFQVTDPSSTYAVEQARVWVDHAILEAEQIEAPRYLLKYGLSTMTEPLKLYEKRLLRKHDLDADDRASWPPWVKQDLEVRRRRLANFLKQINNHRTIDVVPRSALDFFVAHGRYSDVCTEFGDMSVPIPERIQHLKDVITMISTNQHYDFIVMEDEPPVTSMIGAGLLMMGRPDDDKDWMIFYQSEKPGPDGRPISVAFETKLDMFRHRVGSRIANLLEAEADKGSTQNTLRLLHSLIDELKERQEGLGGDVAMDHAD